MLYKAYHRILTTDGVCIEGPVTVRCDSQGKPTGWHLLKHEEPHTIWEGGTLHLDLKHGEVLLLKEEDRLDQREQAARPTKGYNT